MTIRHIWWGRYPAPDDDRDRRIGLAQYSWGMERANSPVAWTSVQPPADIRNSSILQDPQPMPFVHDLIEAGMAGCAEDDVIFLTNVDVGFRIGITDLIVAAARDHGSAHMKRKEMDALPFRQPTVQEIIDAPEYCGMDGSVWTVKWWRENKDRIPDCCWGRYGWDSIVRNLIRMTGGVEIKAALWHRSHCSFWNSSLDVIYKNPANHRNRLMLWAWILKHGGSDADHLFADGELIYRP